MFSEQAEESAATVVIQLLDPSQGGVLKTWKFQNKSSVSIGRAPECDVEVVDAYVSRTHAMLEFRDGQWVLLSHGRNGVFVNHQQINELPISREVTFRLGSSGPLLVFKTFAPRDENLATLSLDTLPASLFLVDESRLEAEVGDIVNRDEFRRLQEQARALRIKKTAN